MRCTINGAVRELAPDATVADAVAVLVPTDVSKGVAVAVDGAVVPRSEWPATTLCEGALVEVLTAVQGG